jgi:hypothetical protein
MGSAAHVANARRAGSVGDMSEPQQQFPPAPGAQPPATAAIPPQPPYGSTPAYQPAYPDSPAQNAYAAGAQVGPPPALGPGRGADGIARVAFVLAIVSVALGVLYTLLFRFAIIRLSYDVHLGAGLIGAYNLVGQSLLFLVYATTLVLGLLGARGARRLQAGIAIGVGGAGVVGILFALMTNLISAAL